jgi:PAS domain S-box-containing protein
MTPEGPPPGTDHVAAELRRVRELVDDLPAIVWEVDAATGVFTYVGGGVTEILGFTPQEWLADLGSWSSHVHPDDRERAVARLAQASVSDSRFDAEYRFLAKDGSTKWLRDIGRTVNDQEGKPVRIRGVMTDITARKTLEGSLGEAEQRFQRVVERLPAIVYLEQATEDPAEMGRMLYVSPSVEDILGVPANEWVEDPLAWTRRFHPDDRERLRVEYERAAASGSPVSVEYRMYGKDGRVVWFRDEAALVRGEGGESGYWQGIMYDITDRRQIEDHVREVERRYDSLLSQLEAIVYAEETGGDVPRPVYIHARIAELLGISPEEWLADPDAWSSAIHPDDRDQVIGSRAKAHREDAPFSAEYRMSARDGRTLWIRDSSAVTPEEAGRPAYRQGLLLDVTPVKELEARVAEAEERLVDLPVDAPSVDFIGALDTPRTKLYISPRSSEVLGYSPREWYEDPQLWTRIVLPEDRGAPAPSAPGRWDTTYRLRDASGRVVWIRETAHIVNDAEGRPKYWQGTVVDVTATMRAADLEGELAALRASLEQLKVADAMKNTFLQTVSHDLRTPLAAILGLALTLKREDLQIGNKEARDIARRIADNAQRLDRMVKDLLDLDRLSRGGSEPDLVTVDLGELVRDMIARDEPVAGSTVHVSTSSVLVSADPALVGRIVENLLVNAAKHTPDGSEVWVRVEPGDGGAMLIVEDNGPGVPPEDREEIFEAFHRSEAGMTSEGSGLGLALVARFAETHGGRAWVEGRPGGGASFRVFLPEEPPRGQTGQPETADSSETSQA